MVTSEVWSLPRCGHFRGVVTCEVWSLPRIRHLGALMFLQVKSLNQLNDAYNQSIILVEGRLCFPTTATMYSHGQESVICDKNSEK